MSAGVDTRPARDRLDLTSVRQMWQLLEPLHATVYYAEQAFDEAAKLGYSVSTRWPSYFAWRAAPLGPVGVEQVASAFYSFSPSMVAQHVPAAWRIAPPDQVVEARLRAVDRTLRALLDDMIYTPNLVQAAVLARAAADAAETAGRPLAAANRTIGWADEAHLQLWQAATILREHRGDGHLAALMVAGLDPCEALVSFAALGHTPNEVFASRGWSDAEWAAASRRLQERGWLDEHGNATDVGRAGRREVELHTDHLASQPWETLGAAGAARLVELVSPVFGAVLQSGILPATSTLAVGAPPP